MNIKEYLTTSKGVEGSLLIPKAIYGTLIDAVQKKLIGRQFAAIYFGPDSIPGSSLDINLTTADSQSVILVAEGAPVPMQANAYTNINAKPLKYGSRIVITKELEEDSQFALLEQNVKTAGTELAENEDILILAALDGATNVTAGGAAISVANITAAMQNLEIYDYVPTTLFVGAEVANDLRNMDTFVEADKLGSRETFERGLVGKIFGMDVIRFSSGVGTATRAYVIDKEHAFYVAEKRPLTMENYDDKVHDQRGAVVTQRISAGLLRDFATARITTS